MNLKDAATVDFETLKIENRPNYPPRPVGAAIRMPSGKKEYLAWGHPTGNNCSLATARQKLKDAYDCSRVIFHNGSFDLDVGHTHFNLKPRKRWDDTLYLAFLKNPYEETTALKPLSEKYLGMPPDEQDRLKEWILANVPEAKRKKKDWGEHICKAPGDLVGEYAIGDVDRTYRIAEKFLPEIVRRGMLDAYRRELAVTPITLEMERSGIRVDVKRIKEAEHVFTRLDEQLVRKICKKLRVGAPPFYGTKGKGVFNVDSGQQLAEAMVQAGKFDSVIKTPSGQVSTKVENLRKTCNDPELLKLLSLHSVAKKYLTSFIIPWHEMATIADGRLLPRFHQVRDRGENGGNGARSGRYSSSDPNLQQVSGNVEDSANRETLELFQKVLREEFGYEFIGMRDFFLPDEGMEMACIDYNQQELRIFAHFENDLLAAAYRENPMLDVHTYCQQLVHKATGKLYERKAIKTVVFGILYGMGIGKLAPRLGLSEKEAREVKNGIMKAIPGIQRLMNRLKLLAAEDKPLRTWGGREYYCEEPRYVKKHRQVMSFEYKMLNYQIQPSAADCTKQGMIQVWDRVPQVRIALQVHDELVCMIPHRKYGQRIVDAMCDVEMNVPMVAEPKYSTTTWARAGK